MYTELPFQMQGLCTLNKQKHCQNTGKSRAFDNITNHTEASVLLAHGFFLGSFSPRIKGREELCVPAEEGGTQHRGQWSLWNTDPGFGHKADLAAQGWG